VRVSARHQEREVVRFRSGIGEITNLQVARHFRRQLFCVLRDIRLQINGGRMLERFVLAVRGRNHVGMTMPDTDGDDSAESVEISPAALVPNVLHFSLYKHERFLVVEKNSRVQEFLAEPQDFVGGRSGIFAWLLAERRKVEKFHVDLIVCYRSTYR